MKKIIGLVVSCLTIFGMASFINVNAANANDNIGVEFSTLETHSKLKFRYNDTSYEPSNIKIKFGGEVTTEVKGYTNIKNYEYGVVVLPYNEASEALIKETSLERLNEYKAKHYAMECSIETYQNGKFEYSWVISNTNLSQKYTAAMYRIDKKENRLELAKPISRSVRETAEAYYNLGETPELTKVIRATLVKIMDKSGVEYNATNEFIDKQINWFDPLTKHNQVNHKAYDIYAYGFQRYEKPNTPKNTFVKVENGRLRMNPLFDMVIFTWVNKGILPNNPDNTWIDNNIQLKTVDLYIGEGEIKNDPGHHELAISRDRLLDNLNKNVKEGWTSRFELAGNKDLYVYVINANNKPEEARWIKLVPNQDGIYTICLPKECRKCLFAEIEGAYPQWNVNIKCQTNDLITDEVGRGWM